MGLIKSFKEWREYEKRADTLEDLILQATVGTGVVTKSQALNIPAFAGCVNVISNTVSMIPIKLYQEIDGKVVEVKKDVRLKLLNDETGDTLDSFQFKKVFIEDYLLEGAGYAYINKQLNAFRSIHYVDKNNLSCQTNFDPIFKDYDILVNGKIYYPFEYLKILRKTKDGANGIGIISENNRILNICYLAQTYETILQKTGGNKRGFFKAAHKLTGDSLTALKVAYKNIYNDNLDAIVLNDGVDFKELSSTAVENQMNENKKTNSSEICKLFNVPIGILEGNATDAEYNNFIKICIIPIIKAFETALNKDFLLEKEKGVFYFAFDMKELTKADMLTRYKAYSEAVKSGWISKNEIRYIEDYEPIDGLDVVSMSLGDVIFDIKSKKYFTPNMNSTTDIGKKSSSEGGEKEIES